MCGNGAAARYSRRLHTPYTSNFVEAYEAANSCIGIVVSAVLWHQSGRSVASKAAMQAAVVLAAVAPELGAFEAGVGLHPGPHSFEHTLYAIAALATVATILAGRWSAVLWAFAGEGALYWLTGYIQSSNFEMLSLHLAWCGLLAGLYRAHVTAAPGASRATEERHPGDLLLFGLATTLAALVGLVVLERMIGSSDEWAYTFQAAIFAKLHAYATPPPCTPAFQNFWVFTYVGKQFSQYTPGWSYFMVPFVWLRVPWLSGAFCFGWVVVGLARLSRRAMALADDGTASPRAVRAAGVCAALATSAGATFLINGGSRFSHLFEIGAFVWALEALLLLASPSSRPGHPLRWGAVLGGCAALMLATRPVDGGGLGIGLFLYFLYALARQRFAPKTVLAIAGPFVLIGGLTLLILRVQLGKWFTTGYSLTAMIHPWNKFEILAPKPDEWRWGFPLATGSYGWWPVSLAVGFAGLASLGRRGRALNTILFFSLAPVLGFYAYLNLGRGFDWGYGPRYQMILMVPMAVGTGVALARMWRSAATRHGWGRPALTAGGPFAVAVAAMILGVVRIAPLVYPYERTAVADENRLERAIRGGDVHHALVLAAPGTGGVDPLDLTQNLPLSLYPHQDVIVAIPRTPELERCVRAAYPDRAVYRASGSLKVSLRREK